jgi:hypothetical protein
MHTIARQETTLALWDETCDVLVESICGLLWRSRRLEHSSGEARIRVRLCAPIVHLIEARLREVNDSVEAILIKDLEVSCGDDAVYLDDLIVVLIKTSHLFTM